MPTVIDHGTNEREDLTTFVVKHLPHLISYQEITGESKRLWESGPVISCEFSYEDEEGEDIVIGQIEVAQPNKIVVYDRSFLGDFTELAEKYEKYNSNAMVIVILEKLKSEDEDV